MRPPRLFGSCVILSLIAISCTKPGSRHATPEDVWLGRIGGGSGPVSRGCQIGAADRVAKYLCDRAAPRVQGLADLYRTLRLEQPAALVAAVATHSLGLSARTVSALNPRVLVFQDIGDKSRQPTYDQLTVTTFVRGEQLVEIAALDPATYQYNFYLLRFEQACNRTSCTPEDLLTEKIETHWTGWTLYAERDLEDTPLGCPSCHQPFGPGTPKQLLMRQIYDPWMHWSDFRGGDEKSLCPERPADGGKTVVTVDGLDLLARVEGASGRYAGLPVAMLEGTKSGELVNNLVVESDNIVRLSPYGLKKNFPSGQIGFQTREVLCERFHTGTSPTWDQHQRQSREHGLPVPYYGPDVTDRIGHEDFIAGRADFLRRHSGADAFDVAASLLAADVASAVGFVPQPNDSASEILHAMCVRCHASNTDSRLRRARFNAEAIDKIDPVTATAIRRRLSLPKTSPEVMPPVRVGELPDWAIARIDRYLQDHCSDPGSC
jgi:hypothetical protein